MVTPRTMATSARRVPAFQQCYGYRPDEAASKGMEPSAVIIVRMACPRVEREQQKFVSTQREENDERLLEGRFRADALMFPHRHEGDRRQHERVLADDRAFERVEREAGEEAKSDTPGART